MSNSPAKQAAIDALLFEFRTSGNLDNAFDALVERGIDVSDVQDVPWGRFVFFSDPDGNRWAVQQIVVPA